MVLADAVTDCAAKEPNDVARAITATKVLMLFMIETLAISCWCKAPCLDVINNRPHHRQLKAEGFAKRIQIY
jgi:hypothetical protein